MITGLDCRRTEGNSKNTSTTPINAIATADPKLIGTVCKLLPCSSTLTFRKDNKKPKTKYIKVSNGLRKTNVNNQRTFVPHRLPNIG
jgi:hypothetical protein